MALIAATDWNPLIAAAAGLVTAFAVGVPGFIVGYFGLKKIMLDNKREADERATLQGIKIEEIHRATNGISEKLNAAIRAEAMLEGEKKERLRAQVEKDVLAKGALAEREKTTPVNIENADVQIANVKKDVTK